MSREGLDELKQQIPLLDYLQGHDWRPARRLSRGRLLGLCPLHADHQPSFLVDPSKSLFYCYGCGRGGDVIRFAELYHQVRFPQALALLQQWRCLPPLLREAADFCHYHHCDRLGRSHRRVSLRCSLISLPSPSRSSSSRTRTSPPSEVTREPWKSTLRNPLKVSWNGLFPLSPTRCRPPRPIRCSQTPHE